MAYEPPPPSKAIVQRLSYGIFVGPIWLGVALFVIAPWTARTLDIRAPKSAASAGAAQIETAVRATDMPKTAVRAYFTTASYSPGKPAPVPRVAPPPTREPVSQATVTDDGRLMVRGEIVRLEGVDLPKPGALCRRLDGVETSCLDRIAARLAIVTQNRTVTCKLVASESGERVGRCRADKIDLAQDLLRSKLAKQTLAAN